MKRLLLAIFISIVWNPSFCQVSLKDIVYVMLEGENLLAQGNYSVAIERYNKALHEMDLARLTNPSIMSEIYFGLGKSYFTVQDWEPGVLFLTKALDLKASLPGENVVRKGGDVTVTETDRRIECMVMLGRSNYELYKYDEADKFVQKATDLNPTSPEIQAQCLRLKGSLANFYRHDYKIAEENFTKAISILINQKLFPDALRVLSDEILSKINEADAKQIDENEKIIAWALKNYNQVFEPNLHFGTTDDGLAAAHFFNVISSCAATYDKALDYLDKAIELNPYAPTHARAGVSEATRISLLKVFPESKFNRLPGPGLQDLLRSYIFEGLIFYYSFVETPKAPHSWIFSSVSWFQKADSIVNYIQTTNLTQNTMLKLGAYVNSLHAQGAKAALAAFSASKNLKYKEIAFQFIENGKAKVMKNAMTQARAKLSSQIPDSVLLKEKNLRSEYFRISLKGNEQETLDVLRKLNLLEAEIERGYPRYHQFRTSESYVTLAQIQAFLGMSEALIQFSGDDEEMLVVIATHSSLDILQIPTADLQIIPKEARRFRNSILFKIDKDFQESGRFLFEKLMKPCLDVVAKKGNISSLKIVTDGILAYIPFEALPNTTKIGRYLIQDYQVSYPLSARFLRSTSQDIKNKGGYIAFAPVFKDVKSTNFLVKSCEQLYRGTEEPSGRTRALSRDGKYISPLPGTESEVMEVTKVMKANNLFAQYFINQDAREEIIKSSDLRKYQYIHFATHGIVNDINPEFSALLLSQDSTSKEDGILYNGEIYGLDLNADLVVLSACETGLGKVVLGEGILGLSRGWIYAGAKNVIVSLWKVDDSSTSELMVEFYNELLSGKSMEESLKLAKLKLINNKEYARPFYWAAFVLINGN